MVLETAEKVILVADEHLQFVPDENNVVHIDRFDALVESTYALPTEDSTTWRSDTKNFLLAISL